MKIVLNSIKVIGLILLSLVCNIIPMYLLQYQNKLSLPAKWGLGLVYIALIISCGRLTKSMTQQKWQLKK